MKLNYVEIGSTGIEVIDGDRGKNYPHQNELLEKGDCVFLSANNVTSTGFKFDSLVYISAEKDAVLRNGKLKKNDIVITTRGTVGNVAIYDDSITYSDIRINSGMLIVRCNDNVDCKYIYHVLRSNAFQRQIKQIQTGTAQPQLPKSHFLKMQICLPPLEIQKKISSFLGSLDLKIKCNEHINQNLYEQIQTIYCKDFDPVSHEVTGVLSDICKLSTDKVQISNLSVSTYYSTENMQPNKAGAVDASSLPAVSQTTRCRKGDVLVSNIRPYFKKIVYVTEECGCSTDVLCFVPQPDYSAFLFGTLYMDRFFDYMVAGSKGTKMPRGDKQQIMKYPIVVPTTEAIIAFNAAVTPMLEQIAINNKENVRLATMRDTLLPRLMSGELDVSEIEL